MANEKIMIVEDEIVVAMELESQLLSMGYDVVGIVGYGEEAISKAEEVKPDLILMDIKLAGKIDGIEAAEIIHRRHGIPIVFLTAHSDDGTLQRAKLSEPFGYLVKPFSAPELRTTIEVSLHKFHSHKKASDAALWFSRALDVVGGAVILTDHEGAIQQMNPLAETLTGWDRADAIGRHITEVLVLRDSETGILVRTLALSAPREDPVESSCRHVLVSRDQNEIPIENSVIPVQNSEGQLSGVIFAFRESLDHLSAGQDRFSHAANLLLTAELSRAEGDYDLAGSFYQRALDVMAQGDDRDGGRLSLLLDDLSRIYKRKGLLGDAQILSLGASRMRGDRRQLTSPFNVG